MNKPIHPLPKKFVNGRIDVALVGIGGNGSQMLTGLARIHLALRALGHPGLFVLAADPDVVTEANVGRQLFSPSDIGQNKADVLINRLNIYYGLDWEAHPRKFPKHGKADILVGCVDTAAARRDLSQCQYLYWLDLGNQERKGQVILGMNPMQLGIMPGPRKQKHRPRVVTEIFPEILNPKFKEDNIPSCSLAEALGRQDLFINQSVTTFALQLLWQFIRNGGLDIHGYFINLESGRVTPLPIRTLI
jgi:PRTRC genetic system ThiF family protein